MSQHQDRAIGGSLIGGLLGGLLGVVLGGFLGPIVAGVERLDGSFFPFNLLDSCYGFLFTLIGAAMGGVIGAISGSTVGAGLATSSRHEKEEEGTTPFHEPPEAEIERLRKRIAELEEERPEESRGGADDRG